MSMAWPIILIVISNIFYNVCSKQTPENINPFASLTITYLVGAVASGILYFALSKGGNIINEYKNINWTTFVLGLAIVGLEAGSIYMYKAGWPINSAHIFHSAILAIALIFVGYLLYHEAITWQKVAGIAICFVGLLLISKN